MLTGRAWVPAPDHPSPAPSSVRPTPSSAPGVARPWDRGDGRPGRTGSGDDDPVTEHPGGPP